MSPKEWAKNLSPIAVTWTSFSFLSFICLKSWERTLKFEYASEISHLEQICVFALEASANLSKSLASTRGF